MGADLTDMLLISKYIEIQIFLHANCAFSENAWVFSLEDKKSITITYVFQNILDMSNHKTN